MIHDDLDMRRQMGRLRQLAASTVRRSELVASRARATGRLLVRLPRWLRAHRHGLWGATPFAVILGVLLGWWIVESRPPNTYFPYLPTNSQDVVRALASREFRFGCVDSRRQPAAASPGNLFRSRLGQLGTPPLAHAQSFLIASCSPIKNRALDRSLVVLILGDDSRHIFRVEGTLVESTSAAKRQMLANAVVAAAGGERLRKPLVLADWLTNQQRAGSTRSTELATAELTDRQPRSVALSSSDDEVLLRALTFGDARTVSPVKLARAFAPTFHYAIGERFRPHSLDVLVGRANLCRLVKPGQLDDCAPLGDLRSTSSWANRCTKRCALDIPDAVESNPKRYADIEEDLERREVAASVYWHLVRVGRSRLVLQYWLYYLFNDFSNKHEGDWETMQVDLHVWDDGSVSVMRWFASSHEGGELRTCATMPNCRTPDVYVGRGSHANYFEPGSHQVVALCGDQGDCVPIPKSKDSAFGGGDRETLAADEYELAPLPGVAFPGHFGRGNYSKLGLVRLAPFAPADPRSRNEWQRDPLASFRDAPGAEPSKRNWYRFYLD